MDFRVLKYFPFSGVKRLDVVAEFFNLFNSANVSQINPVFGSGLTPIAGFGQPVAGAGAHVAGDALGGSSAHAMPRVPRVHPVLRASKSGYWQVSS